MPSNTGNQEFDVGYQIGESFWSAFEKSRGDMQDRKWKREAQERAPQIKQEMNDKVVYEEARLDAEDQVFMERLVRSPQTVSPEERAAYTKTSYMRRAKVAETKLDVLMPMLLDENPYVAKIAKADAERVMAGLNDMQAKIGEMFTQIGESRVQESEAKLRGAQAGLAEAGAEQAQATTDEMPDRLALDEQNADANTINARANTVQAGAAASNARTNERAEARAGYESLVKTDLEKGRQALEAKKLEIEERGLGARTAQARAELVQTVMGLDLEDQQVEELLKDTGIDTKNLKSRWKGVSADMRAKFKSLQDFRDGLTEKAEKGDKKAAQRVPAVDRQMADFSNLLDDLQMFEIEEAHFDATASPLKKFLKLMSTDIGEDGPARNYYYELWFGDKEEGEEK